MQHFLVHDDTIHGYVRRENGSRVIGEINLIDMRNVKPTILIDIANNLYTI